MQDFRKYIDQELISAVKTLVAQSKQLDVLLIPALVELTQRDIHLKRGFSSVKSYLQLELGMSEDQAAKRSQVVNLTRHHPDFFALLKDGKTHLSHLAMCAPKITKENAEVVKRFLPGQSRLDVLFFLSRLNPEGSFQADVEETVEIKIRCPRSLVEDFEKARKILAKDWRGASNDEVLGAAVEVLLEKLDPMRKAARAQQRAEAKAGCQTEQTKCPEATHKNEASSNHSPKVLGAARHIPQKTRHMVYLRDGGRCTYVGEDGRRCDGCVSLSLDHICMFSRGGSHDVENLRLMCMAHNNLLATQTLSREFMAQYLARLNAN